MTEKKQLLQLFSAAAVLLLMVGTLLSFFISPLISDARVRAEYGENTTVTDTARSPWIYTSEQSVFYFYPDKIPFTDTVVIPEINNGYPNKSFSYPEYPVLSIKTLVLPKTVTFWTIQAGFCDDWLSLERVVLSDGIEELPAMHFGNVPALQEVYLPASITRLKDISVPNEIAARFIVHYAGTKEQWFALGKTAQAIAEAYTVQFESTYGK